MIVSSIDIQDGRAVQLVGGRDRAIDGGDPFAWAERFARGGDLAVIDLDAAMSTGDNRALIERLVRTTRCRVGGGIRTVDAARRWLDLGASHVILGTAASPEMLDALPRDRVIVALDARDGDVVVEGWQRATGTTIEARLAELGPRVAHALVTFVEREGRRTGLDLPRIDALRAAAPDVHFTFAGGVRTPEDIATLDARGCDAQVGMALYRGDFDVADALVATLRPADDDDDDPCWPTVIVDEDGVALGLAWSSPGSLRDAMRTGRGIYQSRSRGRWIKGASSGAAQQLLRVDLDCDRDALRFTVRQAAPGFCHRATRTCWGSDRGWSRLVRNVSERRRAAPPESFTARLFDDPALLAAKLREETEELIDARTDAEITWEAADLLYFMTARLAAADIDPQRVLCELDRRAGAVTRTKRTPEEVSP